MGYNEDFLGELLVDWSEKELITLKRMLARLARQWAAPPLLRPQATSRRITADGT